MNRGTVWSTAAVAAVVLFVSGCGSAVSGAPAASIAAGASGVDMCTIMSASELSGLGIRLDTRRTVDEFGVVGCQWVGSPFTLRLERDEETVAEYIARRDDPTFVTFSEKAVNGRAGVQLQVSRSREDCVQLMDGGSVSLAVGVAASSSLGPPIDPCAEALRIAEMIEPRLPEAG